ncbi:juvenile hormone esterase-like [Phlebotomus argentipes]|uniref:juvenile hormone esterase-like n=1 Tax=Phlebotomus argentipes TaxID=94469 RepID=UPI002892F319|nr:juvenile hormone esterase-like [Phlebotomus argentipes]
MNFLLFLAFLGVNFASFEARISESLKVSLSDGSQLIGRYLSSHSGRGIRAFLGIPYAEAPLGNLRFRDPVPKSPWTETLYAAREPNACLSVDYIFRSSNKTIGSEDCLYLNVYVPQNPDSKDPLPVMVNFHGGGFMTGHGGRKYFGPDYLLDQDVILVSGNNRLGIFGFLSTNTLECPGNFGMKDQVEILKWVQKNIGQFGGDKDSVTIFGQGSGGVCVTYHTISPLSKGLFHRAIAQSGTHFSKWAQRDSEVSAANTRKLAEKLECPAEDVKEMIECLRNVPSEDLISLLSDFFTWNVYPLVLWAPVVEPESENAFLTEDPAKLSGGDDIPFLIGITSNEGSIISTGLMREQNLIDEVKSKLNVLLPDLFIYGDYNEEIRSSLTNMITEFYLQNREVDLNDPEMYQKFTDSATDTCFLSGLSVFLEKRTPESLSSNTFLYLFNHRGESSYAEVQLGNPEIDHGKNQ